MINEIVKELRVIANAFTSLCDFQYEYISLFNGITKKYPLLLMDKRVTAPLNVNTNDLTYTINLYFMSLYDIDERSKKAYEDKQAEMMELCRQFLQEVIRKNEDNRDFHIIEEDIPVEFFDRQSIDATFGVQATVKFNTFLECKKGQFNYE